MKNLLGLAAVLGVGVTLFFLWLHRLPPFDGLPEPLLVELEEVTRDLDAVEVEVTAHYVVRAEVTLPKSIGKPERSAWIFPIFPPGDTQSRTIQWLALSYEKPEHLVSFEDRVMTGWVRPPAVVVSPDLEKEFLERGYEFVPSYVLLESFPPSDP